MFYNRITEGFAVDCASFHNLLLKFLMGIQEYLNLSLKAVFVRFCYNKISFKIWLLLTLKIQSDYQNGKID